MQIRYIVQRARPLRYSPGPNLVEGPPKEENSIFAEGVGRVIIGIFNVALGIILLSLSAATVVAHTADPEDFDFKFDSISLGIWSGAVTIISGACGVASRKIKLMVFVFLVISLVSVFSCTGGCVWTALASYDIYLYLQGHYNATAHDRMYLYMFMSITFAIQAMASLSGAAFTWSTLRKRNSTRHRTQAVRILIQFCITFAIQAMASLSGAAFTWSTLRKRNSTRHRTQAETVCANNGEEINTSNLDFPNSSRVTSPPSQQTLSNGPTELMQNSV